MVQRIRALYEDQLEMAVSKGYIPYKTPECAVRKLEERADPDWIKLHRRIK